MLGLNSLLSMASQSLNAETGAMAITNNNIANVNTPGYSRQLVNLSSEALAGSGTSQDNGVTFAGFTSVRDELLQIGINQATSQSGSLNAQSASWAQIETGFSNTSSDVSSALSSFFSGLSALSTSPGDSASRQSALSSAAQVVNAFHQAASTLTSAQTGADASISGTVQGINQLTAQIANLDGQLSSLQQSGQDGGSIQDQRDQLTTQLAQLVGVSSTSTGTTPTLTTANGTPLVVGNKAYALQTTTGTDGEAAVVDANGQDITASITGGSLGGAITIRDGSVPQILDALDQLATQFASAVNTAQTQGYDQNGSPGQAMFGLPTDGSSAAAGISLALSSGTAIAASSDGTAGSSGNLTNLLAVQTSALPSGQTPTDTYAHLVQTIGSSSATVTNDLTATSAALAQLTTQQASTSGVSVDEETTNLLRYQQAYQAAAQVINTVNTIYSTLMNMSTVTS